jgi:hypothetical protein
MIKAHNQLLSLLEINQHKPNQ